jgi:hypothetical protein
MRLMNDLRPTPFLAQLSNLLGNISIVTACPDRHGPYGREAAGVDAVRIAYENRPDKARLPWSAPLAQRLKSRKC